MDKSLPGRCGRADTGAQSGAAKGIIMPIDTRRAIVRAETLIAIEPFQSDEETRYYLRGTFIQATSTGPVLTATDGHTMIVIRDPAAHVSGLDTIWNCGAKKRLGALLATARKEAGVGRDEPRDLWVDLQYGGPGIPTMTARVAESAEEIMSGGGDPQLMITDRSLFVDGSFPEYRRVFPKVYEAEQSKDAPSPWKGPFHVQAQYLQRAADLAKRLGSSSTGIVIGTPDPEGPSIISIEGLPNVRCLIMPVRTAAHDLPFVPEWLIPAPVVETKGTETVKVKKAA
jgi:hypothetical protein